jgi:electron transfer flavoprotein alpha subunit
VNGEVWAYSESESMANETLSAAGEVAKEVSGSAVSVVVSGDRPGIASLGKKIVLNGPPSMVQHPELVSEAIFRAAKERGPSVILVGGTRDGKEVASRLAIKMGRGCLPDVTKLTSDAKSLFGERGEYAGKVQTKLGADLPCVATVRVGAYAAASGSGGDVYAMEAGDLSAKVRLTEVRKKETARVDLRAAKVIVSAGRGVKRKEDLTLIDSLAKALGGTMGCSRPLSSDLGWLPEEYHIGLTGINVKPDLYLAVGISGQLQHVAGIKDSKVIAAINTDKDAPIFQAADYGIVGDLYQVIPALQKLLGSG